MIDELKKIGLAGLGAAALVVEKTGEAVDALAKHGEKTLENTREMREEISRNISDCFKKAEPEVDEIIDKLSQLSAEGLAAIREKISELEILHAQQAAEEAEREAQAQSERADTQAEADAEAQSQPETENEPDAEAGDAEQARDASQSPETAENGSDDSAR